MKEKEFKAYKEILNKCRDGRDQEIKHISNKISELQNEIARQSERDLVREIYNDYHLEDKISFDDFRKGILTTRIKFSILRKADER